LQDKTSRDIVSDALTVLEYLRDPEGDLPPNDVETYLYLYGAYRDDKCDDWGVVGIAEAVLMRIVRKQKDN